MRNTTLVIILALVVLAGAVFLVLKYPMSTERVQEIKELIEGPPPAVEITTDYEGAKVDPVKLLRGCRAKDCIPSIDDPGFETAAQADEWLKAEDKVFGLIFNGVEKAYPQRILNWHEIVNDTVAGEPVGVSFCPLTGTPMAFVRRVNGQTAGFGVSGYLLNSNFIFYDRLEGNLWQQSSLQAIVGPAARREEVLVWLDLTTTDWDSWKNEHPNTEVLARPLDAKRDYDRYPYDSYEENSEVRFGAVHSDRRLHPKDVVYGVVVNDEAKAYPLTELKLQPNFADVVGQTAVIISLGADGTVKVTNQLTSEVYRVARSFWFAWVAFHPGTSLY